MKISVNAKVVFRFPTCLIVNRFSAGMIRRRLKKKGIRLTRRQTVLFLKELKKYKKQNPDWRLLEATERRGDKIIVQL